MAFTIQEYEKLCESIAIGATKVKYSDKEIEYRSLSDMRSLKNEMEAELFPSQNRQKRKYAEYVRGFEKKD